MDYTEKNIAALARYFASGCKSEHLLGLELEHFVVNSKTRLSLGYENGVELILQRLQPLFGEPILSDGRIIGIIRDGANITIEPAAQLEISIGPARELNEIFVIYNEFIKLLKPILDEMGCELVCAGYHPKSKADDLALIPKKRYIFMDSYFKTTGTKGKNMMKGSAATQVSLDYEDEEDLIKKFRVANILGPLLSFICDNTSVFEGEPFGGRMLRTQIWNDVDPDRSMIVKGALDRRFGFREYAEYVYGAPPVLLIENGKAVFYGAKPASEIFARREMTKEDIEHVASMMFPDVCLKNHLEIRMADSMPIEQAVAYTALLKGIFYNGANLNALYEKTLWVRNSDAARAKAALIERGAGAEVYGKPAREWISEIYSLAENGLRADEISILKPLKERFE